MYRVYKIHITYDLSHIYSQSNIVFFYNRFEELFLMSSTMKKYLKKSTFWILKKNLKSEFFLGLIMKMVILMESQLMLVKGSKSQKTFHC